MEAKRTLESLKVEIDSRLAAKYKKTDIDGQTFFMKADGTAFRVANLDGFRDALVIEYADTWEDGDLFHPGDYETLDEMLAAMIDEIES